MARHTIGGGTKVKTETIDGHSVDIFVTGEGKFNATLASVDDTIQSTTLDGLIDLARRALRRKAVRVKVPVSLWRDGEGRRWRGGDNNVITTGTLTGIHGSNGNVLLRHDSDGRTEQLSSYGVSDEIMRPLTPAEVKALVDAQRAKNAATAAYDKLVKSYAIDPKKHIRAALVTAGLAEGDDES